MTCVLDQLEVSIRPLKRAQYEAFDFRVTDGGVVVRNGSHANPDDHVYTVTVANGVPSVCTCPADEHGDGACKHRLAVAIREPVLNAAVARAGDTRCDDDIDESPDADPDDDGDPGATPVPVADGTGRTVPSTEAPAAAAETGRLLDCSCPDDPDGFPCWPCVRDGCRTLATDRDDAVDAADGDE